MAEALQSSFNLGEIAPSLQGRVGTELYKSALASAHNVIIDIHGGVRRRPGMQAVIGVQPNAIDTTFIPFIFSVRDSALWNITQRGVLEAVENIENVKRVGILHNLTTNVATNQRISSVQTADEVLLASRLMRPIIIKRQLDDIQQAQADDTFLDQIEDFGFPSAVTTYQQRRVIAGSNKKPASLSLSKVGEPNNFTKGTPVVDSDAVAITLVSKTIDQIVQLGELRRLVIFTEGSEWDVTGNITPSQIGLQRISAWGCSDIPVVEAQDFILFVPSDKKSIRALKANEYNNLQSVDLTLLATHIFKDRTIRSIAHAGRLLIVVFDDGTAATCTYDAQIGQPAWSTMDTKAGRFIDVFAIPVNGVWKFMFVVLPTINSTSLTLFEFDPNFGPYYDVLIPITFDHMDAGQVDLPILRDRQTMFHVYHTEGYVDARSEGVLTDDNLPRVALSPALNLRDGSHEVGLPYSSYIETLNLEAAGRRITVPRVRVQVNNTRGLFIGPTIDKMVAVKDRQFEDYDEMTRAQTGFIRQTLPPEWGTNGRIRIEASDAQPMEILAVIPDVDMGED